LAVTSVKSHRLAELKDAVEGSDQGTSKASAGQISLDTRDKKGSSPKVKRPENTHPSWAARAPVA